MDVFVAPFEVVDDTLVCQLFLNDKDVLEKVNDALVDIEVIELCNHRLLVLQIFLVEIAQGVALINDAPNVVESLRITVPLQLR